MRHKAAKHIMFTGLALISGAADAFAHLDLIEHGGLAGNQSHPFDLNHVLATIAVVALVIGIGIGVRKGWQRSMLSQSNNKSETD